MAYIFDGREFARKKELLLAEQVKSINLKPKLVSIIVGDDPASIMYQNMKKKAGERVGAEVEILILESNIEPGELIKKIEKLNEDTSVNGVMVQLPLPDNFSKEERDQVINDISPEKDVDGLRPDSKFIPPTAKAVLEIFSMSEEWHQIKNYPGLIVVVGGSGFIGSQIVRTLQNQKWNSYNILSMNSKNFNKEVLVSADCIISVTGKENLIKKDLVKNGAVLIDVGAPKGDIEKSAYEKASFVSPVPGGVGPVTISCLMENLIESSLRSNDSLRDAASRGSHHAKNE